MESRPKLPLNPISGHIKDVHLGIARSGLQVLPGMTHDIEDFSFGADKDGGSAEMLE